MCGRAQPQLVNFLFHFDLSTVSNDKSSNFTSLAKIKPICFICRFYLLICIMVKWKQVNRSCKHDLRWRNLGALNALAKPFFKVVWCSQSVSLTLYDDEINSPLNFHIFPVCSKRVIAQLHFWAPARKVRKTLILIIHQGIVAAESPNIEA